MSLQDKPTTELGVSMQVDKKAVANRNRADRRILNITTGTALAGVVGSVVLVSGFNQASIASIAAGTTSTGTTAKAAAVTNSSTLQSAGTAPTAATGTTTVTSGGS